MATDADTDCDDGPNWSLLGFGGALSLCCLFAPAAAAGVGTGTAAAGATAGAGGGFVQVAVSAVTVGVVGAAFYALRS
ncbi:hypothetical protein [Halobacterium yunchengense]|uniref:hypothetical protein n=1 Tax=Halobacterium yunchengense TaxID=3108497 RepID=UPI003009B2E0